MAFEFTDANFDEHLKSGKAMVVDLWAQWCGPCRMVSPMIDEFAEQYDAEQVLIGKMDVDANTEIPTRYGVISIPTILFIKDGEVVERKVGAQPKDKLKEAIDAFISK